MFSPRNCSSYSSKQNFHLSWQVWGKKKRDVKSPQNLIYSVVTLPDLLKLRLAHSNFLFLSTQCYDLFTLVLFQYFWRFWFVYMMTSIMLLTVVDKHMVNQQIISLRRKKSRIEIVWIKVSSNRKKYTSG